MGRHIEIGSGPGSVLDVMRRQNYRVYGLDIRDTSFREDLRPVLYDGHTMPFHHKAFDTALLPTILHHTPDPDHIIMEAARISKRVIIIEDVYEGRVMEWLTKRFDSLMNLEFKGQRLTVDGVISVVKSIQFPKVAEAIISPLLQNPDTRHRGKVSRSFGFDFPNLKGKRKASLICVGSAI